jgi:SAM-dependent methyltransferase
MVSDFQDHFSGFSTDYRSYRPRYPDALFSWIASACARHERAWDCATGTGQAATGLVDHFSEIIATDASETQIASADKRQNIQFIQATAEKSGIESESVDLVTVAQAIHWFDLEAFQAEVDRVLKKGGVLAVWSYDLLNITPEIDSVVNHLYGPILDKFWPPERRIIENGYRDIDFPYEKIEVPGFSMSSTWNLAGLAGYLNTWSAVKRYIQERKTNPVEIVFDDLSTAWGEADRKYQVRWPMTVLVWQK